MICNYSISYQLSSSTKVTLEAQYANLDDAVIDILYFLKEHSGASGKEMSEAVEVAHELLKFCAKGDSNV